MQKVSLTKDTSNKPNAIKKIPFIEVSEVIKGINNKSVNIKAIRLLIRYLTKWFGYYFSSIILSILVKLSNKCSTKSNELYYMKYLLETNKLRIDYLECLSKNNLDDAVSKKNKWARIVANKSLSKKSRCNAKAYLSLLSRYGYYDGYINGFQCRKNNIKSDRKFYLYGPNAKTKPSLKYKNYTLVLMKPMEIKDDCYRNKILFLNSVYYNTVVSKNEYVRKSIIKEYDDIYVSCQEAILTDPFVKAKFPLGDNIAGAMALGRVLYNLINSYGEFSCVIEGFDFYLESTPYGSYYPTMTRKKNNTLNEQVICSGLAHHDALYNFLYAKSLVCYLDVIDSLDFKRIMEYNGKEYLDALSKARNFKSLCNIF